MFYEPQHGHGLPHNPFNAVVTPRPIGWISTRGGSGADNLAPYSFFNAVAYEPPQVMFASTSAKADRGDTKDSVANIRDTGVFAVNIVEYAMKDAMNRSSGPWGREVDEFVDGGLDKADCQTIDCAHNKMVIGEVTGVHMDDACLKDGLFDVTSFNPLARLGYKDYGTVRETFSLTRPGES